MHRALILLSILLTILSLNACSGGSKSPSIPDIYPATKAGSQDSSNRDLWGFYDIIIDPVNSELTAIPNRTAMLRCNVNNVMELNGPQHLKFANVDTSNFLFEGRLGVDIGLEHPFTGLDRYSGFDVYGVFMSNGSGTLGYDSILYPVDGLDGTLENADGYTRWFNMPEFTAENIAGYTPGIAGTPGFEPGSVLNGYKVFADGLDADGNIFEFLADENSFNDRFVFRAGSTNWRRYELKFPVGPSGPMFQYQYAVHASWLLPDPNPPMNIPDDFPLSANIDEANFLRSKVADTLWFEDADNWGGDLEVHIDIWDWRGALSNTDGIPGEVQDIKIAGDLLVETWDGGFEVVGGDSHYSTVLIEIPQSMLDLQSAEGNEIFIIVESAEPSDYADGGLIPPGAYPSSSLAAIIRREVPVSEGIDEFNLTDVTPPGWPATIRDVWIQDEYAYCVGSAGGLIIFDVSGGAVDPIYVGGHSTDGEAMEIGVDGNYAYVADGKSGLVVFDITIPSSPMLTSIWNELEAQSVWVNGDGYCYISSGKSGMTILDIGGGTQGGTPSMPVLESNFDVDYAVQDVFVLDGLEYIVDYQTNFKIIDVGGGSQGGTPQVPQLESTLDGFTSGNAVYVENGYAYVSELYSIFTVDVSDPASPFVTNSIVSTSEIFDLWVDDGYLYAAATWDGLKIYSLSDPAAPSIAGTIDVPGTSMGVFKTGDFAYMAAWSHGLRIVDVLNPQQPSVVGRYFTPHHIYDLQLVDGFVYNANGGSGLDVVDVGGGTASPTQPLTVGRWDFPDDSRGVWVEDGYAYLAGGWSDWNLYILDVGAGSGSPYDPTHVSTLYHGFGYGCQKSGPYLYMASYQLGMRVFDIDGGSLGGSQANPKLVTTMNTNTAWELDLDNGYAYVADGDYLACNLYSYDIGGGTSGTPDAPVEIDTYDTDPDHNYDVIARDGYAYVASGGSNGGGLRIFDIGAGTGSPDNIEEVSVFDIPNSPLARGITEDNGYVFIPCSNGEFHMIDVGGGAMGGSVESPKLVDSIDLPGDLFCVLVDGQYAYVGTHVGGLRVVSLWD